MPTNRASGGVLIKHTPEARADAESIVWHQRYPESQTKKSTMTHRRMNHRHMNHFMNHTLPIACLHYSDQRTTARKTNNLQVNNLKNTTRLRQYIVLCRDTPILTMVVVKAL
jgi:hypothetical protein